MALLKFCVDGIGYCLCFYYDYFSQNCFLGNIPHDRKKKKKN